MSVFTVKSHGKSPFHVFRVVASFSLLCIFVSAQSNTSCPDAQYGALYTNTNGTDYELYCGYDWTQDIVQFPNTDTFEDCLLLCDAYSPEPGGFACGAATWAEALQATCYLKRAAADGGILGRQATGVYTGVKRIPGSVTGPPIPACPASNNTIYTDAGNHNYTVQCGLDTKGNNFVNESQVPQYSDLYRTGAGGSYQECFYQCGLRNGCLGFTWQGTEGAENGTGEGGCFFKQQANDCNPVIYNFYLDQQGIYNNTLVSALREDQAQLIMNTCVLPTTSGSVSATSPPASISTSEASTTSSIPSATPSICPVADGSLYTDTGSQRYTIYCADGVSGDAVVIPDIPSLDACLLQCDAFGSGCGSAVYTTEISYCYLKPPPEQGGVRSGGQDQVGVKYYDVTTTPFPTTTTIPFPTTMTTPFATTSTTPFPTTSSTTMTSSSIDVIPTTSSLSPSTLTSTTDPSPPSSSPNIPLPSTTVMVTPLPSTTPFIITEPSTTIISLDSPLSSTMIPETSVPTISSSYIEPISTTGIQISTTTLTLASSSIQSSIPILPTLDIPTVISFSLISTAASSTLVVVSTVSTGAFTSCPSSSEFPSPFSSPQAPDVTTVFSSLESASSTAESTTLEFSRSSTGLVSSDLSSVTSSALSYTAPSSIIPGSSTITSTPISILVSSPIVTSALSSTASNVPPISASACAAGTIETQLSSSGVAYAVECSADTDGTLVAVVEAPNTYTQCFNACDLDPRCLGFTYVGAQESSYGVGRGFCYLKAPTGAANTVQLIPDMQNFVSAIVLRPLNGGTSSIISTDAAAPSILLGSGDESTVLTTSTTPPTSNFGSVSINVPGYATTPAATSPVSIPSYLGGSSTTSSPLPASSTTTAAACVSTGQQSFTSSSGYEYDFQCGSVVSDDGTRDQLDVQASSSYSQCFAFCDSAALCDAFTYTGAIAGSGPGICSLFLRPSSTEVFTPLASNIGEPTNVAAIRRRAVIVPAASSTTPMSTATSASCTATAVSTIVSTAGNTYRTQCGARTSGGTEIATIVVMEGSQDCYMFCDADEDCVAFTYADSQRECVLLGEGTAGGTVSLVGGSAAGFFAAVRFTPPGPSTIFVTPIPGTTMSGTPSGSSGAGPSVTPVGSFTGVTASESLKSGCVRMTTVIALTA